MDVRRRQWLSLASAASCWPVLARANQTPQPSSSPSPSLSRSPRISIALAARHSLYQLPLTLADQLGFFRQAGLSVDFLPHEAGSHAMASLLSGKAEVMAAAFEHVFTLKQQGHKHQAFALMGRTPQVSMGVASRRGRLRSLAELKGSRVGISALGSSTHAMASQWLLLHGVLPEDVNFVEVGASPAVVEALREGSIDALCNPDPLMHWLEQKGDIVMVGEARSLQGSALVMGGAVPGACLMASEDFLLHQPAVAQALSDGVVRALKWLKTAGPSDLFKTVPPAYWMNDRGIYLGAFEKLRESYALDGVIQEDAVHNLWRAQARLTGRLATSRAWLMATFDNRFALRAKSRFAA